MITWFDRVRGWKPMVLPPRGPRVKRGVFATRSPPALRRTPPTLLGKAKPHQGAGSTATGTRLCLTVDPPPSAPLELLPQHTSDPSRLRAHT